MLASSKRTRRTFQQSTVETYTNIIDRRKRLVENTSNLPYHSIPNNRGYIIKAPNAKRIENQNTITSDKYSIQHCNDAIVTEADQQSKGKEYADVRRHAKKKNIQPGRLCPSSTKAPKQAFYTTFHKDPVKVVNVNGSEIIMKDKDGRTHRRNSALVKKVSHEGNHVPINGEIDNDTIIQTQGNIMALEEIPPPPIMEAIPPPPII